MKTCVSNPFSSVNQTAARYFVLLTLVSISCVLSAHAQNRAALHGQVHIAAEPQDFPLQGASISLVRKSDGSTVLRTSSDQHGLFRIARWNADLMNNNELPRFGVQNRSFIISRMLR